MSRKQIVLSVLVFAIFFCMWVFAGTATVRDSRVTKSDIAKATKILDKHTVLDNPTAQEVLDALGGLQSMAYLEMNTTLVDDACTDLAACKAKLDWACPKIGDSQTWIAGPARITMRENKTVCEAMCKPADPNANFEVVPIITFSCTMGG